MRDYRFRILLDSDDEIVIVQNNAINQDQRDRANFLTEKEFECEDSAMQYLRIIANSRKKIPALVESALAKFIETYGSKHVFDAANIEVLPHNQDVYHRIYFQDNAISIITMQYFDEIGYNQDRFLSKAEFDSEESATQYICDVAASNISFPNNVQMALDDFMADHVKYAFDAANIEVLPHKKESNESYYRILLDRDNLICIVEMQYFDEIDYNQDRFLSKKEFGSEESAAQFICDVAISNIALPKNAQIALEKFMANHVNQDFDDAENKLDNAENDFDSIRNVFD